MSKNNPKIQFEMDISNRYQFTGVHGETFTIYLKQGDGTSYIQIHATRKQMEEIANGILLEFRIRDRMKEEEETE